MNKKFLQILYIVSLLGISFHFLSERIDHRSFPSGDEGSWLSVAAEASRGHGFTTRWLEHPFLTPYSLPRPDDYRYPGLVSSLAVGFRLFGISYDTALRVVLFMFLVYSLLVYLASKKFFGTRAACLTMACTVFSLLQLYWNTIVYTEGLFGIVVALLLLVSAYVPEHRRLFWILAGAGIGVLYLVRPNGILFGCGFLWLFLRSFGKNGKTTGNVLLGLVVMGLIMGPWLARNFIFWGNPFHIAGSAGLLRVSVSEPLTYSVLDFLKIHGILFPLKAAGIGCWHFLITLQFFEHGLEIIPLAFCLLGLFLRVPGYNPFIAAALLISFASCAYASKASWSGVRYFSSLLPFVYAYGFFCLFRVLDRLAINRIKWAKYLLFAAVAGVSLAPVFYPHRYYERTFLAMPPVHRNFDAHLRVLSKNLHEHDAYLANRMAQVNFLTEYNCVGMQEFFDSTSVGRALCQFTPKLLAVTPDEEKEAKMRAIMREIERNNFIVEKIDSTDFCYYYLISASDCLGEKADCKKDEPVGDHEHGCLGNVLGKRVPDEKNKTDETEKQAGRDKEFQGIE
jgi:Dolichyl-phosphate-mannose-protein mannosyltransferase